MRKRIGKYITMGLAGVMLLSCAGCNMVERTEESKGKTVLAKIGDKKITKDDVDEALKSYLDQYKQQYGDDFESNESLKDTLKNMRKQELQMLVENEVLMQSKDDLGVNPTDEEIQKEVDEKLDQCKQSFSTDDEYNTALEQAGYTEDSFVDMLKERCLINKIIEAMFSDLEVTDDEIETYYNDNKDQYISKPGADVTHLLFQPEKDEQGNVVAGGEEAAKALADKAREKAVAGTSLKDLSTSDEFKDKCKYEDLGRVAFENSGMVQEFEDAFKVLPANQVSEVVKTSFGYHIIYNTAVYQTEEQQPLDDKLKEDIKATLLNQKQQEEYDSKIEELKEKVKAKVYEDRL